MKDAGIGFERHMPTAALAASVLFVIWSFSPALAPLADGSLMFMSGDLSSMQGPATLRAEQTNFILQAGAVTLESTRFFLLGSLGWLAEWVEFSDSQFQSMLMLVSILIGSAGIHWLVVQRTKDHFLAAALTATLVVFYFMNPWSAVRLVHLWIWITYAVLPMQLALGLRFIETGRLGHLGAYSLLLGIFGPVPHSLMYMLAIHMAVSFYGAIGKGRRALAIFAVVPLLLYVAINAPFITVLSSYLGGSGLAYPEDTSGYMLEGLSRNGELVNLLAFDNFWWPLAGEVDLAGDVLQTSSSIGILIVIFSIFALAYGNMDYEARMMSLAGVAAILIFVFLAQGLNNEMLGSLVGLLSDNGLDVIIGPFREWARICLMIPVFLTALVCFSIPWFPKPAEGVAVLGVLVLINLAGTPSWIYLNHSYPATSMEDAFQGMDSIPYDARITWFSENEGVVPAKTVTGVDGMVGWPKAPHIGSPYGAWGFKEAFFSGEVTKERMELLRISYLVLWPGKEQPYGWMSCEDMDYVRLCSTGISPRRFDAIALDGEPNITARVSSYRRMDPTRWEVRAESSGPFLLTFAEDYLPGWEARIVKDGTLSTAKAIQVEGSITGFRIDERGDLGISVVFAPQETFEAFKWASVAGMLACLAMIGVGMKR